MTIGVQIGGKSSSNVRSNGMLQRESFQQVMKMTWMMRLDAATLAVALLVSCEALAQNVLPLGDMPIRYMTDEDREILKAAIVDTLDHAKDGSTVSWENPKTGAHGNMIPKVTYQLEAKVCRDLEVANSARGRDNRLVTTLCKQPDGDWKIDTP